LEMCVGVAPLKIRAYVILQLALKPFDNTPRRDLERRVVKPHRNGDKPVDHFGWYVVEISGPVVITLIIHS